MAISNIAEKLIGRFHDHAIVRDLERQEHADTMEQRRAAQGEIDRIATERDERRAVLVMQRDETVRRIEALEAQLAVERRGLAEVEYRLSKITIDAQLAIDKQKEILLKTAPAAIEQFKAWLLNEDDRVRKSIQTNLQPVERNGVRRVFVGSNAEGIAAVRRELMEALSRCDNLKLTALTDDEAEKVIETIKAEIQNIPVESITVEGHRVLLEPEPVQQSFEQLEHTAALLRYR